MENLIDHEIFMQRCLQLAVLGAGQVAPNPMVGAVLVHGNEIIGEGYHQQFGTAHAEVNCINSVAKQDKRLIPEARLYVSLEPCSHKGKTPPCSDRIISEKIKHVLVGSDDPFPLVNGKGIGQLQAAGIRVETGILKQACDALNKRFFCFHQKKRPYIILKWAQTANGKMGFLHGERLFISQAITQRWVHKWRAENAGILVGTRTALLDNPRLDVRYWPGKNPVRLVLDRKLNLPGSLHVFNQQQRTILLNELKDEGTGMLSFRKIQSTTSVQPILDICYKENIQSLLVEGGPSVLKSFIDQGIWDEAYRITNEQLCIRDGLDAPRLPIPASKTTTIGTDRMEFFIHTKGAVIA